MKQKLLSILVCPQHQCSLSLEAEQEKDQDQEIRSGQLRCPQCKDTYPIVEGVPRFTPQDHYSSSFGWQWNKYDKTQLDSHTGLPITRNRYKAVCQWKQTLESGWGIEAGCGAGRFTELLATEGIDWVCVDASSAVDANYRNNGSKENVHIVQADLRFPPFKKGFFDRMICLGVLQHTPDPDKSFFSLLPLLKDVGGEFAFDIYSRTASTWMWSKYWIRPLTKKMDKEKLFKGLEITVPFLLFLHDLIRFILPNKGRTLAHRLIPVCSYKYTYPFDHQQNLEWALLDTFDMLSPEHDHPRSLKEVKAWLGQVQHEHGRVEYGPNGIIGQLVTAQS